MEATKFLFRELWRCLPVDFEGKREAQRDKNRFYATDWPDDDYLR